MDKNEKQTVGIDIQFSKTCVMSLLLTNGPLFVVSILNILLINLTLSQSICNYNPIYHDTYLMCKIFENTNIDDTVWWFHLSHDNYCDFISWYPFIVDDQVFNCSENNLNITRINFEDYWIYGYLNTSFKWPQLLHTIDLEWSRINVTYWDCINEHLSNLVELI